MNEAQTLQGRYATGSVGVKHTEGDVEDGPVTLIWYVFDTFRDWIVVCRLEGPAAEFGAAVLADQLNENSNA